MCVLVHLADKGHLQLHAKTVSIEGDEMNAVLCTLRANTLEQTNLALVFGYDVPVCLIILLSLFIPLLGDIFCDW